MLSPRNYDRKSRESAASLIPMFRNYLHYHIKCSKAYLVRRKPGRQKKNNSP